MEVVLSAQPSPINPFPVGSRGMFATRCQTGSGGMRVDEVDANMFDVRLKVEGRWGSPVCFVTFSDWKKAHP